jgi:hypothetical protein
MPTRTYNTPTTSTLEPIKVVLGILQSELGLDQNHIYLANQDHIMPKDGMSVMLEYLGPDEPIASKSYFDDALNTEVQQTVVRHMIQISIMSLAPDNSARIRKEEIALALQSFYSQRQQDANQIGIAWLTDAPVDGSYQDGTTMLHRFITSCFVQALHQKIKASGYFDNFPLQLVVDAPENIVNVPTGELPYA